MIVLKNLEIEESLTRYTTGRTGHECGYCGKIIPIKQRSIKTAFRYDGKLYPIYFHSVEGDDTQSYSCYAEFTKLKLKY